MQQARAGISAGRDASTVHRMTSARVMTRLNAVAAAVLAVPGAVGLQNGLGLRPGMGWNWDYCGGCVHPPGRTKGFDEHFVLHIGRFINTSGLQAKGYKYVNTDSSWGLDNRSASGSLQPNPQLWPSGMPATVSALHAMGLGFGLYGDRGTYECNGAKPGQLGHETQDADFFASMGIDWFNQDSCYATGDRAGAIAEYTKMSEALMAATAKPGGRPIWFALCGWQPWYAPPPAGRQIANSWRVGPDSGGGWSAVMANVNNVLPLGKYAGFNATGGGWNDLSLLLTPGMGRGADAMTLARVRSQFSLHCVLAANLMLTGNLSTLDPVVLAIWGNEAAIAVNQDPLGLPHRRLPADRVVATAAAAATGVGVGDARDVTLAECGGEPARQAWAWTTASTVVNGGICLNVRACHAEIIVDGCSKNGCGARPGAPSANEVYSRPPPGGGPITVSLDGKNKCVAAMADGTVGLSECAAGAKEQRWAYDAGTQQIKLLATQECLTAPGTAPPPNSTALVVGRPLERGRWAVLFLNNAAAAANMTCGPACFAAMGFSAPPAGAAVDDLWSEPTGAVGAGGFAVAVQPDGASRFVVVTPKSG